MTDFNIKFFGWAHNPDKNEDKIWGFAEVEGKLYNFWGRRVDLSSDKGRKLSFKRWDADYYGNREIASKADSKMYPSGGKTPYRSISCAKDAEGNYPGIEAVYKDFNKAFKNQLTLARLFGDEWKAGHGQAA